MGESKRRKTSRSYERRSNREAAPLPPIPEFLVNNMQELVRSKLTVSHLTAFDKLRAVYDYIDQYNTFVATFTVCQKGCNHCCKIDVQVSPLEAEFISGKGSLPLDRSNSVTRHHRTACPFLGQAGECTIYNNRPFNCRTFHTIDDPKYCAILGTKHVVYGSADANYGAVVLAKLAEWIRSAHGHGAIFRDIRDWFPQTTMS